MRSTVNRLISTDAAVAPAQACHAGTPNSIIGGAIISVRATVQPTSAMPEPFLRSSNAAEVLYVGSAVSDAAPKSRAISGF